MNAREPSPATTVQLSLFEDEATQSDERAEWAARFERAEWIPAHFPYGPVGARTLGWVCPCCGDVEPNACLLNQNHGYDPDRPGAGYEPFGRTCVAQMLRRAHAAYDAHAEAAAAMCAAAGHTDRPGRRHVNPGACDECWNATRGGAT